MTKNMNLSRRTFLRWGVLTGTALAFEGSFMRHLSYGALPAPTGCDAVEEMPVSPFIIKPFRQTLPIPKALKRGWQTNPEDPGQDWWTVRKARFLGPDDPITGIAGPGVVTPGPGPDRQDTYGHRIPGEVLPDGQTVELEHAGEHQVWPSPRGQNFDRLINWQRVEPLRYHIRLQVAEHSFTNSRVRPIDALGNRVTPPVEAGVTPDAFNRYTLPASTIYGFNGTFPGSMINAEMGKPVVVRFENDLDQNPQNLDRGDFGAPDLAFLTHLHNGHTAPESDGNPHYMQINEGGYMPGDWCDNLYLNYPAGGDPSETMSFLWFHDHRMHHTGANVYKGMVGLYPVYDPGIPDGEGGIVPGTGLDTGNESDPAPNLRLPGIRRGRPGRPFNVKYDIPMALFDVALDDGITPHGDQHIDLAVCGNTRPDQWGRSFFQHFPNEGFVGDLFTVNGVAFPHLDVHQRRYRFRFLDASVARVYELCLMTSANGPVPIDQLQPDGPPRLKAGQWQIPDGVQWRPFTQIASMGGLLPTPQFRNSMQIWPADRKEVVIDFTDVPTGTVIYLTNIMEMNSGRKYEHSPSLTPAETDYKVPLVKIIVGGPPPEADESVMPVPGDTLRPAPAIPDTAGLAALAEWQFILDNGGGSDEENRWVINDLPFDPFTPQATFIRDQPVLWTNINDGGGWVHPMHMHQEEHTVITRDGDELTPDDNGKSDVTNLAPGETVTVYRNFRTFTGRYVAHCHNLAHEDHNMMFGWEIVDTV
ncbi:MAG: multicopper oxidase domain-containing protein [Desulforhopalus sp.]